ncbi:MAG: DUF5916 domain-containing protein [Acidobacteriota bacterium]
MTRSVLVALALATASASAQPPVAGGVHAHAQRTTSSITIDGHLDEPAWAAAPKQSGFTERFPKDGAKPQYATRFAVLYDDAALYVGVWADDPEPAQIRRLLTRRDVDSPGDWIAVGIDSYHDRRTGYVFMLDAAGVQRDQLVYDDQTGDDTWDAVWTGDVAITDQGWTAEFRIPLNQLRFSSGDVQAWGFQILRIVGRTQEQSTWSPWPRTGPQIVSKFGVVDGIEHLQQRPRLELLPYATAGVAVEPIDAGDPLNDHVSSRANIGLDLKYGLGPAFTLSATINPDFGQVEADPSQVNLGPTELFFAEKRPFFLEGMDLFRLPIGNSDGTVEGAFYSRRIGAVPAAPDMSYQFVRTPSATTIYGAAKLTGKTDGWSVGLLDAVTGSETTTVVDDTGKRSEPMIAPVTNYAVARVKRDFNDGGTVVAASGTAVDRAFGGDPLANSLRDQAYTGGLLVQHHWDDNAWQLDVHGDGSWVHGTPAAILATQTDNVHLYQRPGAKDVTLDPARTSLAGLAAGWNVGRLGATKHWRYGFGGDLRTPGVELNDAGFQTSADRVIPFLWGQYHDEEPSGHVLNWQVNSDVFELNNFEPTMLTYGVEGNGSVQLDNYWSAYLWFNVNHDHWDTIALRGGPALRIDPSGAIGTGVATDNRKRVWTSLNASARRNWTSDMIATQLDLGTTIQARSNIDLYVDPAVTVRDDPMQYVAEADDTSGVPHYVLGRIQQTTVSLTTRVDWTFSPHLSLQVYAQPFVSAGRYSDYKDVNAPRADRFTDRFHVLQGSDYQIMGDTVYASYGGTYSFDKPDFDVRQLRSTVVLRWEYLPGSTVFAIWSHGQTSTIDDGRFRLGTDVSGLASASAENIVMVKANYWIGL